MTGWNPVGGGQTCSAEAGELRVGTQRRSMRANPLLARAELGKVKPSTFSGVPDEHVFGYSVPKDPEGAREVTMIWKEHTPSPGPNTPAGGKVQADFKTMNKNAAKSGLTTAKQLPAFRAAHMITVKAFDHTQKAAPALPNDANPGHVFGKPSAYRTADVVRTCGPVEPSIKHLIQGAYQDEWLQTNLARDTSAEKGVYIPPVPTRATLGHTIGAMKATRPPHAGEEWKMSKFKAVGPRVTAYMGKSPAPQRSCDAAPVQDVVSCEGGEAGYYDHPDA